MSARRTRVRLAHFARFVQNSGRNRHNEIRLGKRGQGKRTNFDTALGDHSTVGLVHDIVDELRLERVRQELVLRDDILWERKVRGQPNLPLHQVKGPTNCGLIMSVP